VRSLVVVILDEPIETRLLAEEVVGGGLRGEDAIAT